MNRLRTRAVGFTLLEVLIALAIFSIGALGALSMMMGITTLNSNSAQMMESQEIANYMLEQFEVRPPADASINSAGVEYWASVTNFKNGTAATITIPDVQANAASTTAAVHYQVKWISDAATGMGANIRHWRVRVRWPKNRDLRGLPTTDPKYLDCFSSTVFNGGQCMATEYHTYRKMS